MPRLSIILPVHNAENTVQRAVQSILLSEFEDFELLVHDDGSTDRTPAILQRYRDPRIRCTFSSRRGLVPTLGHALSQTRAPLIARMDADDRATPDRFARQLEHLHENSLDAVGGLVRVVDANGAVVPSWRRYESWVNSLVAHEAIAAYRFVESPIVNPTALARREVFELGFRDGPWPEDYDFWLRVLGRGFRVGKVARQILDWTDHPSRYTRTDHRFSPDAFDRCRRMHLLDGPLRHAATIDLWGAGQTGKRWLRWLREQEKTVRHLIDISPRKIGQTIHNSTVVDPDQFPPADGTPLIVAVGAAGARERIETHLRAKNFVPGENTWFVA